MNSKSINARKILHIIIVFILMFGFRYIPPIGEITSVGMQGFRCFFWMFVGMDFLWKHRLAEFIGYSSFRINRLYFYDGFIF